MKESLEILILVALGVAMLFFLNMIIKEGKAANEKTENELLKFAFDQVLDLADTIVKSLNQTIVEPLKNSETLNFDKKAQKEVLETAKGRIKDDLDKKSKDLLEVYLGSAEKVDGYIEDAVESKIFEAKRKIGKHN